MIKERATTSSYGLRLLRTVSGNRGIASSTAKKIDTSVLPVLIPMLCVSATVVFLVRVDFGKCTAAMALSVSSVCENDQ